MTEAGSEIAPPGFSMRLPGSWCHRFAVRDDIGEVVALAEDGWVKTYVRMDLDDRNDLVYLANDALSTRRRMDWRARLARRLLRVPFSPYNRDHTGAAHTGRGHFPCPYRGATTGPLTVVDEDGTEWCRTCPTIIEPAAQFGRST